MSTALLARVSPTSSSQAGVEPGSGGEPGSLSGSRLGRYALATFLGRGGMADVYAASPVTALGPAGKVAIKRMLPHLAAQPRLVELFLHEAELACRLAHPNLVRCLDFGTTEGVPFMALEFVDGIPCDALQQWLSMRRPFPPRMALAVLGGVLSGLVFAHEAEDEHGQSLGIVHMDVSPDNILISRHGQIKVTDFGVAQSAFGQAPAASHELRGKPGYMSPEQIIGMPVDPRSDVFSVGVVLAEFLLGRHVFDAKDALELLVRNYGRDSEVLSELSQAVPAAVAGLVRVATARHPDARFQSSRAFLRALTEAAADLGGLPDSGELASWLIQERVIPNTSGVYDLAGIAVPTYDLSEKIDEARPTRGPEHGFSRQPARRLRAVTSSPRRQRWRIGGTTGDPAEVCSFAQVVERLVTGRAGPQSPVARENGPFVRLGDFASLASVVRVPAYRLDDCDGLRPEWSAPLDRARLPSLLHDLATRGVRGVLSLTAGRRKKRVYFDGGRPVFVASTDPAELFGQRLLALGMLEPEELDELVTTATREGRRLGQALVAAHVLPAGSVLRLLVAELERRVLELACWAQGEVSFTEGARPGLAVPTELAPPALLACQLVRDSYCDQEVASFLDRLGAAPLAAPSHRGADASRALLTDLEQAVIGRAAGQVCHGRLFERWATDGVARPEQSRRALYLGLSVGLLTTPGWSPWP